jgi:hypothetical protein
MSTRTAIYAITGNGFSALSVGFCTLRHQTPHKPKDKAKAEGGVLLAERWILARLRNRQFFSLPELNAAIKLLLSCPLRHRTPRQAFAHPVVIPVAISLFR